MHLGSLLIGIVLAAQIFTLARADEGSDDAASGACPDAASRVAGIDVSKYQGTVRWSAVRQAGVQFVFVRVSDGIDALDERFLEHWQGARASGLLRGAYQYFRPSADALAQARLFMAAVRRLGPGDLPPVLDVETLDGLPADKVVAQVQKWMTHVSSRTGRSPILYTNASTWEALGAPELSGRLLWIARWSTDCPLPLAGFSRWHFWQHSNNGRVDGIGGAVDLNWFNGTLEELRLLSGIKPRPRRSAK